MVAGIALKKVGASAFACLLVVELFVQLVPSAVMSRNISDGVALGSAEKNVILSAFDSPDGYFTENRGQAPEGIRYYSMGNPSIAFRDDGVIFVLRIEKQKAEVEQFAERLGDSRAADESPGRTVVYMAKFEGANRATPVGRGDLSFESNFFIGNDPNLWRTNVPSYREVTYGNLYDGIDLTFHLSKQGLKYEFIVRPGADPSKIKISYRGIDYLSVKDGALVGHSAMGDFRDAPPISFQEGSEVRCDFVLRNVLSYGFQCDGLSASKTLIIDPLLYATFLGGDNSDEGYSVAADAFGSAYVLGRTKSIDFPTTLGVFDDSYNGDYDLFVTRLSPAGDSLIYSTYLGGSGDEFKWTSRGGLGRCLALDSAGNVYIAGNTNSTDFPTIPGSFNTTYGGGPGDAFLAKLDATGSQLLYSTYLGGDEYDAAYAVVVDSSGNAYVTGQTNSVGFPTTPGASDTSPNGFNDAFVVKLNSMGSALIYSTFLGGKYDDEGFSIALDASDNAYITGYTFSPDFPTTPGVFMTNYVFCEVFVTKLNADASALIYSTYFGGYNDDWPTSIVVDSSGSAYITGSTNSSDFPVTLGAFDTTFTGGIHDAFVTKFNATASGLVYSTFLAGTWDETGDSIALDSADRATVVGNTFSPDFPTTPDAYDRTLTGIGYAEAFVTTLNPAGSALVYSTFLGGSSGDQGNSVFDDKAGNLYAAGLTWSADFPTTPLAYDTILNSTEAFVVRFSTTAPPNRPPEAPWPLCIQGACSTLNDSKMFHITDRFTPTLSWTHVDPDGDPQYGADIAIYDSPARTGRKIWEQVVSGAGSSYVYDGPELQACTEYWFSARTRDMMFWSAIADLRFHVNCPPAGLDNLWPINWWTTAPRNNQRVWWSRAWDADWATDLINFTWQVASDVTFSNVISEGATMNNYSAPFITNLASTYCWHVNASDGWESISYTPTWCFTTGVGPRTPAADQLTIEGFASGLPTLQHITERVAPVMGWRFVDGDGDHQSAFHVQVRWQSNDSIIWELNNTGTGGGSTSAIYAGPPLTDGTSYYFEVKVRDDSALQLWGDWSDQLSFRVNTPPPTPIEPVVPPSGATIPEGSATVQWTSGGSDTEGDAVQYEYCVDMTDPPAGYSVAHGTVNDPANQSSIFSIVGGRTYYWFVRAYDGFEYSTWSTIWHFTAESSGTNTPPIISLGVPPSRLKQGDTYVITWTMSDLETPASQLVVYLNYSFGGNIYSIVDALVGVTSYQWTIPAVERTDVRINATIIDRGGLQGWSETPEFEVFKPPVNDAPQIVVTSPTQGMRLKQGTRYAITWTMCDAETPPTQLVVYLNYSYGGNKLPIAGPLLGFQSYEWSVPIVEGTDFRINATVIDEGGLRAWSETADFEVYRETPPIAPSGNMDYIWLLVLNDVLMLSIIFILIWHRRWRTPARSEPPDESSEEMHRPDAGH